MTLMDWTVVQHENGFGTLDFDYDGSHDWVFYPVTDEEKRIQKEFVGMGVEVYEEDTGRIVNCETKVEQTGECTIHVHIEKLPLGGLYTIGRKQYFRAPDREYAYDGTPYARHVGVGDVFVIAGQSNAAGWGKGDMEEAAELGISVCRPDGKWDLATHPFSGDGHSPFLKFAKTMRKYLNYPIGLIPRAVGGSSVDMWYGEGAFIKKLEAEIAKEGIRAAAVLWYQGCTDAEGNEIDKYFDKFSTFVTQIRTALCDDELPIFTFQLNKVRDEQNKQVRDEGYSKIREIQRTAVQKIKNTYVIPTIDAAIMSDAIHNAKASNMMLGDRLAHLMLDVLYHKRTTPKAPDIKEALITGEKELTLIFSDMEAISTFGASAKELPIRLEDEEGELSAQSYTAQKDTLKICYDRPVRGQAWVSGMYGASPVFWLIDDVSQLPVLCFDRVEVTKK